MNITPNIVRENGHYYLSIKRQHNFVIDRLYHKHNTCDNNSHSNRTTNNKTGKGTGHTHGIHSVLLLAAKYCDKHSVFGQTRPVYAKMIKRNDCRRLFTHTFYTFC